MVKKKAKKEKDDLMNVDIPLDQVLEGMGKVFGGIVKILPTRENKLRKLEKQRLLMQKRIRNMKAQKELNSEIEALRKQELELLGGD